jgi:hypothetical protein
VLHDDLEKIYINAMNFDIIKQIENEIQEVIEHIASQLL